MALQKSRIGPTTYPIEWKKTMSLNDVPAGKNLPNDINVVIEIPANHNPIKYEVDKDSGALVVRSLYGDTYVLPRQLRLHPSDLI